VAAWAWAPAVGALAGAAFLLTCCIALVVIIARAGGSAAAVEADDAEAGRAGRAGVCGAAGAPASARRTARRPVVAVIHPDGTACAAAREGPSHAYPSPAGVE